MSTLVQRMPLDGLLPDSGLAKAASALAASMVMVDPRLVLGLIWIVFFNAIATVWYAHTTDGSKIDALYWLTVRIGVYALVMPTFIILGNMLNLDLIHRAAMGGAAGWEAAITAKLCTHISPRWRPLYESLRNLIDDNTPLEIDDDEVADAIEEERP